MTDLIHDVLMPAPTWWLLGALTYYIAARRLKKTDPATNLDGSSGAGSYTQIHKNKGARR